MLLFFLRVFGGFYLDDFGTIPHFVCSEHNKFLEFHSDWFIVSGIAVLSTTRTNQVDKTYIFTIAKSVFVIVTLKDFF